MQLSRSAFLLLVFSVVVNTALAQRLTQDNGDCTGALFIADSVYVQEQAVRGFGNVLEIKENPSEDKQWFEREHHTTWYKFRAPNTTLLTFDIEPKNIDDDIDFLVFEGAIPGICDKIQEKTVAPIRTNISRNDKENHSICGLRKDAPDKYVRSGVGSSFSSAIEVKQGDLYYLVVDYQDRPLDGYTIRFHYDPPPPPPVPERSEAPQQTLRIHVTDAKSGKPVTGTLTIEGMVFDKVVEAKGKSTYEYRMDQYRSLKIGCVQKGFMFQNLKVKGSTDSLVVVDLKLTPIEPGAHVVLEDIRFVGNDVTVMKNSQGSMLQLLRFMQQNPTTRIEIEGHVNGPTYKNTKEFIELSTGRARAVYDFLLVNDVEPERLAYKGYGNSQMLFPEPKNKDQSEAHRRQAVKIL